MSKQALYRQWRPARFADVSGQDAVITTLRNQIATGRISHAYLFCGSRGTGKTTTAKLFARAVNCLTPDGGEPCGVCEACQALSAEGSMDIVEIDAASNNGVDEIRDLREKVKYPPQNGRYRVYIIDEVHMLSTGAFNALLKTLEEPPPHALFILATTEPQRLPATVLSRVQRYDFRRIPAETIVARLGEIVTGERGDVTGGALSLIARASEGGMRDAISLLDMALSYGGGSVDEALVREILGSADRGFLFAFSGHLIDGDARAAIEGIHTLMQGGREPQVFARDMSAHLRALLMAQTVEGALADLLEITEEDAAQYREQAARIGRERLLSLLDLFLAAESDMRWASQPRTALEVAAVKACLPEDALRLDALSARVEMLERRIAEGGLPAPAGDSHAAPQQAPTKKAPAGATKRADMAPSPAPQQPPLDAQALWEKAKALLRKEPQIYAHIMQGRFAGIDGDVAHLVFEKSGEIFMNLLKQDARRELVEQLLTQAAGRPMTVSLSLNQPTAKKSAKAGDSMQQVIDAFGRENVQIVDDIEP